MTCLPDQSPDKVYRARPSRVYARRRRRRMSGQPTMASKLIVVGSGTAEVSTLNRVVSNNWAVVVVPDGRMPNVSYVKLLGDASVTLTVARPVPLSVPPAIELTMSRPLAAL